MKRIVLHCIALFALLAVCSCGGNNRSSKLKVAVSIPPEKYIVEAVAGDLVDVFCIMEKGNNPESFEPTISQIVGLYDSDVYFAIGLLDFERGLINTLHDNGNHVDVVSLSDSLELLYGTHGDCEECHNHGHHHGVEADPHVWSSLRNAKKMAEIVCQRLGEIDSENKTIYANNCVRFSMKIDSLDTVFKAAIDSLSSKSFIVWHPSLSYFANDYGLTQISVGSHTKELSIGQLRERIAGAVGNNANVFFFQNDFDSSQAVTANEKIGARFVEINPMNEDIESELKNIVDELSKQPAD